MCFRNPKSEIRNVLNMPISKQHVVLFCLLTAVAPILWGQTGAAPQSTTIVRGRITDTETLQSVGFATVKVAEANTGAVADEDGVFSLKSDKLFYEIQITAIGYRGKNVRVQPGKEQTLNVSLTPEMQQLKEVTVRPEKYRNKNNPTVELIRHVIAHRDQNRLENLRYYGETQYEKIMVGLTNVPDRWKSRKMLKSVRFWLENADSSKNTGSPVVPLLLQENAIDFYSRNLPKTQRKYVTATQSVEFPEYLHQGGVNQMLRYLNQDVNVYDNFIELFTNQFLSPIADNAPLFYRYYPMDTTVEEGLKIVHLSFFPRNKTDMLLQGDLYVALDSTYPVVRTVFGINPQINLNFVKGLELEQGFKRLPSGKWMPAYEDARMDFGITQNGLGLFGQRLLSHNDPNLNATWPDSLFATPDEYVYLPNSAVKDTAFWAKRRYAPLSKAESATYTVIDSLQKASLFAKVAKSFRTAFVGYIRVAPGYEFGPWVTLAAFNAVEGARFRVGGRTNPKFSTKIYMDGFVAYGTKDDRFKYGANASYALGKSHYNNFPLNVLRASYLHDLRIPGQELFLYQSNSLATSFVRGVNDRFLFVDRYTLQYEREFKNHLSFNLGMERQTLQPEGSLHFDPMPSSTLAPDAPITTTKAFAQLRFAPKERFYQNSAYRQQIDLTYIARLRYARSISGFLGGQYHFHEVNASVYKFSKTAPLGYNYLWVEGGGVFGRAPYPLLAIHRANQTYISQIYSYSLMNFMEFVSDRYVAVHMDHNFYGFFLNKIPLLRKLKLREMAGVKVLYGRMSDINMPVEGTDLYHLPAYPDGSPITYALGNKPYVEANVGIGNIFKVLRIDVVRRFTYLDHPGTAQYGLRAQLRLFF